MFPADCAAPACRASMSFLGVAVVVLLLGPPPMELNPKGKASFLSKTGFPGIRNGGSLLSVIGSGRVDGSRLFGLCRELANCSQEIFRGLRRGNFSLQQVGKSFHLPIEKARRVFVLRDG